MVTHPERTRGIQVTAKSIEKEKETSTSDKAGEQHYHASHPVGQLVDQADSHPVHMPEDAPEPVPGGDVIEGPAEPPVEVRRSGRSGAGHHSNPHHLLQSVIQSEVPATPLLAPVCAVDPQVLANISRTHLLLAQPR